MFLYTKVNFVSLFVVSIFTICIFGSLPPTHFICCTIVFIVDVDFIYTSTWKQTHSGLCTTVVLTKEAMAHNSKDTAMPVDALNGTRFPISGVIHLCKLSPLQRSGQRATSKLWQQIKASASVLGLRVWDLYWPVRSPSVDVPLNMPSLQRK